MKFGVVSDLLSDISIGQKNNPMQITWIQRNKIIKNERNGYVIGDVSGLAEDIRESGLAQPLEVLALDNGSYRLLTGERRLTAIDFLIDSGNWDTDIPCIVKELEDYDLPLSSEAKEMYAIIRTNRFTRKMTDADLMFEAGEWSKIIHELKKDGRKEVEMTVQNGKSTKVSLQGRTREIAAEVMGISNGQMGKIEYVKKNAVKIVRDAVENGRMKIAAAYTLSQMAPDKQEEFMQFHESGEIDSGSVTDYQRKILETDEDELLCDDCANASSLTGNPDDCANCGPDGRNFVELHKENCETLYTKENKQLPGKIAVEDYLEIMPGAERTEGPSQEQKDVTKTFDKNFVERLLWDRKYQLKIWEGCSRDGEIRHALEKHRAIVAGLELLLERIEGSEGCI